MLDSINPAIEFGIFQPVVGPKVNDHRSPFEIAGDKGEALPRGKGEKNDIDIVPKGGVRNFFQNCRRVEMGKKIPDSRTCPGFTGKTNHPCGAMGGKKIK
jgi:hypothetical protein